MRTAYLLAAVLASAVAGGCAQTTTHHPPASSADHATNLCHTWASTHHMTFASMNGESASAAASFLRNLHAPPVPWLAQVPAGEFVAVCVASRDDSAGLCFNGGPARGVDIVVIDDHRNQSMVQLGHPAGATPCPSPSS